jgi:hypothetical protein
VKSKHEQAAGTGPKLSSPVALRLGELEPQVAARVGATGAGAIIKRDLGRYYALLTDGLQQTHFTLPEAEALVFALMEFEATSIRYLWAEVERQYLAKHDELDRDPSYGLLPDDLDAAALVDKLRRLSLAQSLAVLDAVERYWMTEGAEENWPWIDIPRLVRVGLLRQGQAEQGEERRRAERGHLIVRDPARNLRRNRAEHEE